MDAGKLLKSLSEVHAPVSKFRLHSIAMAMVFLSPGIRGQTTIATGGIVGTVKDASRAVIAVREDYLALQA